MANVGFNAKQYQLYLDLKKANLISQTFSHFIHSIYHKEIDRLRSNSVSVDLSHDTIEALTFQQAKKQKSV